MKPSRHSYSIRTRLVAMTLLVVLLAMVGSAGFNLATDISDMEQELRAETRTYAGVLSQDFAQLILLDKADLASELVGKLSAFPKILRADLYDMSGQVLLRYKRESADTALPESGDLTQGVFADNGMAIKVPVGLGQSVLGEVVFLVSTERLEQRIRQAVQMTLLYIPALVLLMIPVAVFLQRFYTRPLLRLLQGMRDVSSNSDYGLRLKQRETAEFGELYRGFNHMLETIEQVAKDLSDQSGRLQVTLESIADGVITTDSDGNIDYMNPEAERLCGFGIGQARGQPSAKLLRFRERSGRHVPNPVRRCLEQRARITINGDCELVRQGDIPLPVQASVAPIMDSDRVLIGSITAITDISHSRAMAEELNFRANHDDLTGLINRFAFGQQLREVIDGSQARDETHALLYMDLDQFKLVNDTCGHGVGDELLREVSALLRAKVRSGDTLSRLGGDEFGMILKHCSIERAADIAEEIRSMIEDYRFSWGDRIFDIGISIGVIQIHKEVGALESVLADADSACYEAKEAGRNKVYIYRDTDHALSHRKYQMALVSQVRQAIDEDKLVLYAQPIRSLRAEDTSSHYEVLVRMLGNDGELIPPVKFLGAAERYGLIEQLDRWVLSKVVSLLREHRNHVEQLSLCSINLSGASLGRMEFLQYARELLDDCPGLRNKLCFEITETVAISSMANARHFIDGLRGHGVRFALDDFGTGMSSLSYLKVLPVDLVKIDGAFVRDMLHDRSDHALVVAMNNIAHEMGKTTVAEFVESADIQQALRDIGVDYAQGYHVGKPMPLEALMAQSLPMVG